MTVKVITFGASVLLLACSHEPPPAAPGAEAATAAHTVTGAKAEHGPSAHEDAHSPAAPDKRGTKKNMAGGREHDASGFAVPFVWETSRNDPLAIARGHLKEMLNDNAAYVNGRGKLDPAKIRSRARTTIVACSDAAVQLGALDATPENDTFVTRNWGNLLEPSLGSITYGVEELHTPVLLIVGHTGCDAVKAVISGTKFSKPVRSQIDKLKVKPSGKAETEADSINASVVDNVNKQVAKAVERFQPLVRTGVLTVIGAVYDPTNALKRGQGRLSIVNVNTITDPVSMSAFVTAVTSDDKIVQAAAAEHAPPPAPELATPNHVDEPQAADEHTSHKPSPKPSAQPATHEDIHHASKSEPRNPPAPHAPAAQVKATTTPQSEQINAHGLPRIDRLEASLVGETHHEAAREASHHVEDDHGH